MPVIIDIKELLEKRANLIAEARALFQKAEDEKREPTAKETEQFDKFMDEADGLKTEADAAQADVDRRARLDTAEADLEQTRGRQTTMEPAPKPEDRRAPAGDGGDPETRTIKLRSSVSGDPRNIVIPDAALEEKRMQQFARVLVNGMGMGMAAEMAAEQRALQADSDVAGGFLVAPEQFQAELIQDIDNAVFMRQIARVLPPLTNADSLGVPSLDTDLADLDWTVELGVGSADSSLAFGKRQLKPQPLAKLVKISKTLMRKAALSPDAIVRERIAFKNGAVQETAFLNGSGAGQPLGVFTASDNGISTGRDVSTGNTTTTIGVDGLIEAQYSLTAQYRQNLNWIFHRDAVKMIRKLKDGEGRYIWQQSIVAGNPDSIMGVPVRESEYAPNTFTNGLYVGLIGDFRNYWIVDALTLAIQVLTELYAATNQNGYIARSECDGMPVNENAFARVKLAP